MESATKACHLSAPTDPATEMYRLRCGFISLISACVHTNKSMYVVHLAQPLMALYVTALEAFSGDRF